MAEITRILEAIDDGDTHAAEELLPLVYDELRKLAAQRLSHEKPGQTLQATALVHEAYIRLVGSEDQHWDSRGHFFSAAAEAMRRILVERARRKRSLKHGGQLTRIRLDQADISYTTSPDELLAIDEAVTKLALEDAVAAKLVKLRFFGGLNTEQAAEAIGISRSTAYEQWAYAKVRLRAELGTGEDESPR